MAVAIEVEGLSKKYRLGEYQAAYGTLRETLVHAAKRLAGREHHRAATEHLGAPGRLVRRSPRGRSSASSGRNGAGKSTLLKILTRISSPTAGRAEIRGRVGSLLEVGTGFQRRADGPREHLPQRRDPRDEAPRDRANASTTIVEFSGVETFIDTPVKRYSSGMYVRLAFAVAAHLEPEILLVDEVLAVGDAEFQRPMPRPDGGVRQFGADGALRLPQHAGRRAALRSRDPARRRPPGARRAERGGRRVLPADVGRRRLDAGRGPTDEAPGDDLVRLRSVRVVDEDGDAVDYVDVRRPVGIELAFTVLRRRRPSRRAEAQGHDRRAGVAFNAMDIDPAGTIRRRRATTSPRPGSRGTC